MDPKFIKWGNGKNMLIFLHYFGGNANGWKWVADEISVDFTCIAIHLPGFGNSKLIGGPSILNVALNIKAVINKTGIRKYSLIGHSMGGKIALQLAAIDKERTIKNLILISPSPPGIESISPEKKLQLLRVPSKSIAIEFVNSLTAKPLKNNKLENAINAQLTTTEFVRHWWVNKGSQQSIINQIQKIKCPITVISSKSDKAINISIIKNKVIPLFDRIKLIEVKNSGHLYPLEIPGIIAKQIENVFL